MPSTRSPRFISMPAVLSKTSCSRAWTYNEIKEGRFPKQVKLGARRVGFLESEIDAWIDARIAASRQQATPSLS
jgi:prophage regulatory protein